MKRLITILIFTAALSLALPVLAKPPGHVPPGHAKNKTGGGGINIQINTGAPQPPRIEHKRKGPPPWAPAHGYRAKHKYRYWPDAQVYYEPVRKVYFWFSGGGWQVGVSLPSRFRLGDTSVSLEMNATRPYRWHKEVITYYPPY